jgi:hypothetical protein
MMPISTVRALRGFLAAAICACTVTIPAFPQTAPSTPRPAVPTSAWRVDMSKISNATDPDANKAAAVLERMVRSLGGERYMEIKDTELEGRTAGFYHGNPSGSYTQFWSFHQFPDKDRVELTKQRNVVEIVSADDAWEITFQGKHRLDKDVALDFMRRRAHSLETVLRVWLQQPNVALFYGGQVMVERHLADEVTVMTADNDSVTIRVDIDTHLPRSRTFYWRDPLYKDKNEDGETYDDWHYTDGFPTSFLVTRYMNGDMTRQTFLKTVTYNQGLDPELFNPDLAAAKIH